MRLGRRLAPYGLTGPGALWLVVFFLIPMFAMLVLSLETPLPTVGFKQAGYQFTWHFSQYSQAWSQYHVQFVRSLVYAGIVTAVTLVVGYPVAYWIAFKGGTQKTTYLFLILLPFFVSFVIRSLAWQFLLSSDGIVFSNLERIHVLPQGFHVLGTSTAVISGIAYNSLPFMVLPLYVSLEKVDRAVVEAASDLYASSRQVFLKVILPLSIPGIFAGFLLTFIPAVGRLCEQRHPRRHEHDDDRQHRPAGVPQRPELPAGVGPGVHPDDRADDRDSDLRPRPRDPTDRGVRVSASVETAEPLPVELAPAPHRTPKRSWKSDILGIYTKLVIAYLLIPSS